MRILSLGLALGTLFTVGACSGDVGNVPDAGAPSCKMALYDPCREEHDCTSGNCKPFPNPAPGMTVCTMTCTPGDNTTCPQQDGVDVECNAMGICKPPMATACHIPGS